MGPRLYFCGGAWGQREGLTAAQVAQLIGGLEGPHYVWTDGMSEWEPAASVPEIVAEIQRLQHTTVPPETEAPQPGDSPVLSHGPLPTEARGPLTSSVQALDSASVVGPVPQQSERTHAPAPAMTTTQALRQQLRSDPGMRRKLIQLAAVVTLFIGFMALALILYPRQPHPADRPPSAKIDVRAKPAGTPEEASTAGRSDASVVRKSTVKGTPEGPTAPRIDAVSRRPVTWVRKPIRDPRRSSGNAEASSELREGGGTLHGARNVSDSTLRTAWCEGNPGSDGEGEWLQLATDCSGSEFRDIIGLEIASGYTDRPKDWAQNNRPSKLRLTMSVDGEIQTIGDVFLADRPGDQFLELPRPFLCQTGQRVRARLEVLEVYQGTSYSDACISGLAIYERLR
ncbi:MAG: DUF4339 domain-containing protein [Myxococcota bacterium]|nr:DUF4339 domain-containing protein [Myxococcota bacterium]